MNRIETDPGRGEIQPRKVVFDWAKTPLHWMRRDPTASHVYSALNMMLPAGEGMICQTLTEALPLIADEKLRRDVLGFLGQESVHSASHDKATVDFLQAHGINTEPFVAQGEYLYGKLFGPRPLLSARASQQYLLDRLAVSASLEHLFAFLGDWALNADLEKFDPDPMMLDLYRWHGAEEVEHRHVVHDVTQYFEVGYLRRNIAFLLTWTGLLIFMTRGAKFLTHADPSLDNPGYLRTVARLTASMLRGSLPAAPTLLRSLALCLRPGYSPEAVGDTAQALAYLATSPAARAGAL
ncbi:metal-dependent hydrolase [Mycobacteroides abscessus]|uniref:metal-dependent hydrolase n=1 Tax=Mycobacteroides abscessus TaxID=36809 RepID=UPI000360E407|nr:metal-dependent hydrolase [Mycobacteroides abscessus]